MPLEVEKLPRTSQTYRPRRDVAVAIVLKVVLLALVGLLFLGFPSRPASDAAATAAAIVPGAAGRAIR